jgi:GNAT superfamily N-acetyltransferase
MNAELNLVVRKVTASDGDILGNLINGLADTQKLPRPDSDARLRLKSQLSQPSANFEVWLAEFAGKPAGYAITFYTYSTFLALPTLHLEDIFVLPEYRSQGVGTELFKHCAKVALTQGCGRMEWFVLDSNQRGREFYQRFGAEELEQWILCRLNSNQLENF